MDAAPSQLRSLAAHLTRLLLELVELDQLREIKPQAVNAPSAIPQLEQNMVPALFPSALKLVPPVKLGHESVKTTVRGNSDF